MNKTGIQRFVPNERGDSRLSYPDGVVGFWVWETTIHDMETPDVALLRAMRGRVGEHHYYRAMAASHLDAETLPVESVFDYQDTINPKP